MDEISSVLDYSNRFPRKIQMGMPRDFHTIINFVVFIHLSDGNVCLLHLSHHQITTKPLSPLVDFSLYLVGKYGTLGKSVSPAIKNYQSLSLSVGRQDYVSFDKYGSKKPVKQGENEHIALKFQEHDLKISGIEENLMKSKKQMALELCLLTKTVYGLLRRLDYLETVLGIKSRSEGGSPAMSQVLTTTITSSPNSPFSNFFEASASTRKTGELGDMVRNISSSEPVGGSFTNMLKEGNDVVVPTHLGLGTPTCLPPPN